MRQAISNYMLLSVRMAVNIDLGQSLAITDIKRAKSRFYEQGQITKPKSVKLNLAFKKKEKFFLFCSVSYCDFVLKGEVATTIVKRYGCYVCRQQKTK